MPFFWASCTAPSAVSTSVSAADFAGDNVVGQHLATRGTLGYVVTDAADPLSPGAVKQLRESEHALWVRTW